MKSQLHPAQVACRSVMFRIAGHHHSCSISGTTSMHLSKIRSSMRLILLAVALWLGTSLAAQAQRINIGFVYSGSPGDGGWTHAHDQGRLALEAALGPKVRTYVIRSVPSNEDDVRRAFDAMNQGEAQLVFGTTYGFGPMMAEAARTYPAIRFEHATGDKTSANLRTYDARFYQATYLAGLVAGLSTRSGTVGIVASVPIPEVRRNINSFALGVRQTNPRATVQVIWLDKWNDPVLEGKAAQRLVSRGADILFQNTDSTAVIRMAESLGVRAFGIYSDMGAQAPKAHLGSVVINWGPYYIKAAEDVLKGNWQTGQSWWGIPEGTVDLVNLAPDLPPATVKAVETARTALRNGDDPIWKGPVLSQSGATMVAAGSTASDIFLLSMKELVQGIEVVNLDAPR